MGQEYNRDQTIKVMVTKEEKQKIQEIADRHSRSVSSYGRFKMLEPILAEAKSP